MLIFRQLLERQSSELVSFCILIIPSWPIHPQEGFLQIQDKLKWNWVLRARARQITGILHERSAKFFVSLEPVEPRHVTVVLVAMPVTGFW